MRLNIRTLIRVLIEPAGFMFDVEWNVWLCRRRKLRPRFAVAFYYLLSIIMRSKLLPSQRRLHYCVNNKCGCNVLSGLHDNYPGYIKTDINVFGMNVHILREWVIIFCEGSIVLSFLNRNFNNFLFFTKIEFLLFLKIMIYFGLKILMVLKLLLKYRI